MNEIVNNFLFAGDKFMPEIHLTGDKFMSEIHLKQPRFIYSACGPFTKNKERIQKFEETGDTNYIYKNEFDKACFQQDMVYEDFKDLARTASDKVLRYKGFNIAKSPKYDGYQRGLASMVYKFLYKKSASGSGISNNEIKQNLELAEELHKPKEQFIQDLKTIFVVLI